MAGAINHWLIHAGMSAGGTMLEPFTRPLTYEANKLAPTAIPDISTMMDLSIKGILKKDALDEWAEWNGVALNVSGTRPHGQIITDLKGMEALWEKVYWAKQQIVTPTEIFELANRGVVTNEAITKNLSFHGYAWAEGRNQFAHLRYDIPGPSDLVRFAVRHVFEPDLIEQLGYNDEYRPTLDIFHNAQGLNYPILGSTVAYNAGGMSPELKEAELSAINSYNEAGIGIPTWAQCYWWSHWVLPSPSQGYQMLFRLRPDRIVTFDPPEAKGLSFDIDSLNLLLRANDYPPFYRPYLAAISHATPGIRFLRQLVNTDVFGKAEVIDTLRRQGYSDGHADVLAESVIRNDKQIRRKSIESNARGQIEKYYSLGIIDGDKFVEMLVKRGVPDGDAIESLNLAQTQLLYERVKLIVTAVKRQMVSGKIDSTAARDRLQNSGISAERASQYVEDWALEVKVTHREISAEKAVKWACSGYISIKDLISRLTNLGFAEPDVLGLVAEAETCASEKIARALAAQAKQDAMTQRQLKQIQQQAINAHRVAQQALARHGNPTQLRKWFCEGHISEINVYNRLEFLGWPPADITRLIADCKTTKMTTKYTIAQDGTVSGPTGTITETIGG